MPHAWSLQHNWLLAALSRSDQQRRRDQLEPVELKEEHVLYEPASALSEVHFLTTATVSLMYAMENGDMTEIAEVGREGLVGISVLLRGGTSPSRAVVQSAGQAFRLGGEALHELLDASPDAAQLFSRYVQAFIMHIAQIGACNRHHDTDQRLCRWLLAAADRRGTSMISITQEQVANILGVRRETITASALRLQEGGFIGCTRGRMTLLNRSAVEQRSCECYFVVRDSYQLLVSPAGAMR